MDCKRAFHILWTKICWIDIHETWRYLGFQNFKKKNCLMITAQVRMKKSLFLQIVITLNSEMRMTDCDRISKQKISLLYLTPNWISCRCSCYLNWRKFMHISSVENIKSDLHSCCEFTVKTEYIYFCLSENNKICMLFVLPEKMFKNLHLLFSAITISATIRIIPKLKCKQTCKQMKWKQKNKTNNCAE